MTFPRFDPKDLISAAGRHADTAFDVFSSAQLGSNGTSIALDIYVLVDPEDFWQLAQLALDALGAHLSDWVGYSSLSAPMEYEERILLRLRTGAPSAVIDELIPRLRTAAEDTIREVVGPDVELRISVFPAEESD